MKRQQNIIRSSHTPPFFQQSETAARMHEHLRRENFVIISDENGYYFPQSQKELEIYVQTVSKRARSTFYTLKSARQMLKAMQEMQ